MKSKKLLVVVLGALVVLVLSLPVMAQSTTQSTSTTTTTGSGADAEHNHDDFARSGQSAAGPDHPDYRYQDQVQAQ